jgi:hypothetical protein
MQKLVMAGLALCAFGALWKVEKDEDGAAVALSPFLAALAIEVGIFMLRRHQGNLLCVPARRD